MGTDKQTRETGTATESLFYNIYYFQLFPQNVNVLVLLTVFCNDCSYTAPPCAIYITWSTRINLPVRRPLLNSKVNIHKEIMVQLSKKKILVH